MKSCDGCKWVFLGYLGALKVPYCRARPPQMHIEKTPQGYLVEAIYPRLPGVRCGDYQRRRFGRIPEVDPPKVAPQPVGPEPQSGQPAVQQPAPRST